MIAAAPTTATDILREIKRRGFKARLEYPPPQDPSYPVREVPRLIVEGDAPILEDLDASIRANRDALKVAVLLWDPPPWLAELIGRFWSGDERPVRLRSPASARTEVYLVSLSSKNIAAAVATEIGASGCAWEAFVPLVEEALGVWQDAG